MRIFVDFHPHWDLKVFHCFNHGSPFISSSSRQLCNTSSPQKPPSTTHIYLEYNSTTICSFTGNEIWSFDGSVLTVPLTAVLSRSNHSGMPRPSTDSKAV